MILKHRHWLWLLTLITEWPLLGFASNLPCQGVCFALQNDTRSTLQISTITAYEPSCLKNSGLLEQEYNNLQKVGGILAKTAMILDWPIDITNSQCMNKTLHLEIRTESEGKIGDLVLFFNGANYPHNKQGEYPNLGWGYSLNSPYNVKGGSDQRSLNNDTELSKYIIYFTFPSEKAHMNLYFSSNS